MVCTTGLHLTWIQGEHAVLVNIHVKAMPLTLGGSTNTGGADYELSKHLKLLLYTNMNTTYMALTCASTAPIHIYKCMPLLMHVMMHK